MAKTRRQNISENKNYVQKMMNRKNIGLACYSLDINRLISNYASLNTQKELNAINSQDLDRKGFSISDYTSYFWSTKIIVGLEKLLGGNLIKLDVSFEVGGDESYIVKENGNLKAKIGSNFIKSFEKSTNPDTIRQVNTGEVSCALYDVRDNQVLAIFIIKPCIFYDTEDIFVIKDIKPVVKIVLYAKNSQVKGIKLGSEYFTIIKEIFKRIKFTHASKIDKIATKIYKKIYPNHYKSLIELPQIDKFVLSASGKFAREFWIDQKAISAHEYGSQVLNSQVNEDMYPMILDLKTQLQLYNPPDANSGASTQVMYGEGGVPDGKHMDVDKTQQIINSTQPRNNFTQSIKNSIQPLYGQDSTQPLYRQDVTKGMNMNVDDTQPLHAESISPFRKTNPSNNKSTDSEYDPISESIQVPYWIDGRLVTPHNWLSEQKIKDLERRLASMRDYGSISYYNSKAGSKYTRKIKRPLK